MVEEESLIVGEGVESRCVESGCMGGKSEGSFIICLEFLREVWEMVERKRNATACVRRGEYGLNYKK